MMAPFIEARQITMYHQADWTLLEALAISDAALAHRATACVLTHAVRGALLPVQRGGSFLPSMAAAVRGLVAAASPAGAPTPARGCSSW